MCVNVAPCPVTVSLKVPVLVVLVVTTLSVEVVVPGFGVNETVVPAGWPLRLNVTDPVKPRSRVIVTVYVAVPPRATVADAGLIAREKSGKLVTLTVAVPLIEPLVAVTVKGPPTVVPAVNKPAVVMVPPPLTVQAKIGCGFRA